MNGRKYYFKSNGNAVAGGHALIDGIYYVFNKKGQLLAPKNNAVMKVGEKNYFVTPQGTAVTGWNIYKGKLYYSYKLGRCASGRKVGDITLEADGAAKDDVDTQLKLRARELISQLTTPSMTQDEKLRRCWNWFNTCGFQASRYPDKSQENWPKVCALDMLNTKSGNCYGIANGFAALAKELGYTPYVIEIPYCHCWVMINGRYWDNMGNRMAYPTTRFPYTSDQIYKF